MNGLDIHLEKTVPKRREGLGVTVGNALATSGPFGPVTRILERRTDHLRLQVFPLLGFSFYPESCRIDMQEEGVSTRIQVRLSTHRMLIGLYAAHLLVGLLLFLIDWTWGLWINPERILTSGWIWPLLLIWPAALWGLLRRRTARRISIFLDNLVYLR